MLLCELIVRQTPQGFSLVRIHLKCNLFSPRNQSNTAIRDNYPSENLKTKFKFKVASKKKPDNKHSECTTLICNFSLLSFTIWEMLHTHLLCWYLKINFKLKRKRLKKNNIENISPSSFFFIITWNGCRFYF